MVNLNLKVMAENLAEKSKSTVTLDDKFQLEYKISNITEDILLEEGFTYSGETAFTEYPLYQKENIYALFKGNMLILGEGQLGNEVNLDNE